MITVTTKTPARTIEQDMTAEELSVFTGSKEAWGSAEDAAARGAAYLDRLMPGWAERVEINKLDLYEACNCVLGQLFAKEQTDLRTEARDACRDAGEDFYDTRTVEIRLLGDGIADRDVLATGYHLGVSLFGLRVEAPLVSKPLVFVSGRKATAAGFFGFDHSTQYSYDDLTEAWKPLIESRQTTTTKEN